jgi:hypothetical protein
LSPNALRTASRGALARAGLPEGNVSSDTQRSVPAVGILQPGFTGIHR